MPNKTEPPCSSKPQLNEPETLLAKMTRDHVSRSNASGRTVTVAAPPVAPQPLVATFHRARNNSKLES